MKSPWIAIPALSIAAVAGIGATSVEPVVNPKTSINGLEAHETHASASLLGQFRTSISSWLWLRTDLYLHNGVEMRPMTEAEKQSGDRAMKSSDKQGEMMHNDELITTVIPSREHDFRGVFGDVDRATNAYKDMHGHKHNDPVQALPLFRLMTWLDPAFVPGWIVGGHVIGSQKKLKGSADQALAFLRDGLTHNPNSIAIHVELGSKFLRLKKDPENASANFMTAIEDSRTQKVEQLDENDREALKDAYLWQSLILRDTHHPAEMEALAREGLVRFKDNRVLFRLLNEPPMVYSPAKRKEILEKMEADYGFPPIKPGELEGHDHEHEHEHEEGHDHEDHDHEHED